MPVANPTREEFLQHMMNKSALSLTSINLLLTQSFEMEGATKNTPEEVGRQLRGLGAGVASNKMVNDGNGWNSDSHQDGTVHARDRWTRENGYFDCETSSSPLHGTTYAHQRAEIAKMLTIYGEATGGMVHSVYASNHVHNTVAYTMVSGMVGNNEVVAVSTLPAHMVYRYLGLFFVKFYPVLKWLCMTTPEGARGADAYRNNYDCLDRDYLWNWFSRYQLYDGMHQHNEQSDDFFRRMDRSSALRLYNRQQACHWENRMCDNTASHTQLSAWLAINRAMTLWAVDFGRNGYDFPVSYEEYRKSHDETRNHRYGWEQVDRGYIEVQWEEMKSYLAKYLKIAGCMDAIKQLDKLIEYPVPQYLKDKGYKEHYDPFLVERVFRLRNRAKNEEMREKYLLAIQSMRVPKADKLDDFHDNIANYLGITKGEAKSLYAMFKRENIEIEFLGNRLVYMGDA